ncbi:DEAD/DEAH box helicase [Buchnera aphidicola]|uniref:DEAD/DEAH box helicase n=1 Tax=Buchnera aphidicola TaxID=9 RepID=UPI001E627B9E|nr:DEAD/DEAH box helicase [Buchnera aphidicola]
MYKPYPMDRIVCGDVGFGKTEVAIRAALIAVLNNKQVVLMAPTLLLVQQHLYNFKKRFSKWPIIVDQLSRFYTVKQQKLIIKLVNEGNINILIGTHQLLFEKIKWKNLGLLIIDEEHRFGVEHKEQIIKKYIDIDILTLTATPIPRTLNMVINGLKKVSIIATPPHKKLNIKTYIIVYNDLLIRNNILKEVKRGGQVYYVHNEIKTIFNIASHLSKLIPEVKIVVGHGKMKAHILTKIINDFCQKKFHVLICTTIIETGIDIPTVNTIFIANADYFGLSQLHQIRGRIGRSYQQAYAWLIISNINKITINGKKRLQAIISNTKFGSGLKLSINDLETRGFGEFLGKKQSGHIKKNIKHPLYTQFLNTAITNIKKNKNTSLEPLLNLNPKIELNISTIFPINYITDMNQRLYFYRLISNVNNIVQFVTIKSQLINMFGTIPNTTKNLIKIIKIQLMSKIIGIQSIKINKNGGFIKFKTNNSINLSFLIKTINKEPKCWKIKNNVYLMINRKLPQECKRINWIFYFVKKLKNMSVY